MPNGLPSAKDQPTTPHGLIIIVAEIILSEWPYRMRHPWRLMLDRLLGRRDCLLTRRLLPPSGVGPGLDVRNFRTCLQVAPNLATVLSSTLTCLAIALFDAPGFAFSSLAISSRFWSASGGGDGCSR